MLLLLAASYCHKLQHFMCAQHLTQLDIGCLGSWLEQPSAGSSAWFCEWHETHCKRPTWFVGAHLCIDGSGWQGSTAHTAATHTRHALLQKQTDNGIALTATFTNLIASAGMDCWRIGLVAAERTLQSLLEPGLPNQRTYCELIAQDGTKHRQVASTITRLEPA